MIWEYHSKIFLALTHRVTDIRPIALFEMMPGLETLGTSLMAAGLCLAKCICSQLLKKHNKPLFTLLLTGQERTMRHLCYQHRKLLQQLGHQEERQYKMTGCNNQSYNLTLTLRGYSGFKNPYSRLSFSGFNIMFDHQRVHVQNWLTRSFLNSDNCS